MILHHAEGISVAYVVEETGLGRSTISTIINRFNREGRCSAWSL
ncbi:MAG: helix-turn-helix domain-containing protein [Treponema sp.]|nr:helix-turn-helix domain-containing protein [Treponema sp.]